MTTEHDESSGREKRLQEVLVAYLEAVEAGPAPDQQEWLARYPEFAAELAEFFAGREHLGRLAAPRACPTTPWSTSRGAAWTKGTRARRNRPGRPPSWWRRWPGPCTPPTGAASSTVTSSPPTSCWRRTAPRRSPTSAWPSWPKR